MCRKLSFVSHTWAICNWPINKKNIERLDHFTPGSVWSAVAVLTALEKGFTETQMEKRLVNLRKSCKGKSYILMLLVAETS